MIDDERLKQALIGKLKGDDDLIERVLESQKQWQVTIDAVEDYIFVTDNDHRIRRTNISFAKRFKKHPREIIGLRIDELIDLQVPIQTCKPDQSVYSEMSVSREIVIGDNTYLLSVSNTKYKDEDVCVYVMKDITEVINLKNKLYQSYKITSLGLLVSGVAHEINNPLTGILGFTELLNMKIKDEGMKKELDKIYKAAERCKHVVESLLFFSRQQMPQKNLDSINDIIDKTIALRAYWIRKNDVEVIRDFGTVPLAYIDTQQIQQVILNIFTNAEQAITSAGGKGTIVIHTEHNKPGNSMTIRISDNGAGIPGDKLNRIFDPFFTTKPVNQGTGLGLSIAHGIISEHGGTIRVESKEGEGASFIIEIPMK